MKMEIVRLINCYVGFSYLMLFRCRVLIIICCVELVIEVIESVIISVINKLISEIKFCRYFI